MIRGLSSEDPGSAQPQGVRGQNISVEPVTDVESLIGAHACVIQCPMEKLGGGLFTAHQSRQAPGVDEGSYIVSDQCIFRLDLLVRNNSQCHDRGQQLEKREHVVIEGPFRVPPVRRDGGVELRRASGVTQKLCCKGLSHRGALCVSNVIKHHRHLVGAHGRDAIGLSKSVETKNSCQEEVLVWIDWPTNVKEDCPQITGHC
jgi:hypothetical protein